MAQKSTYSIIHFSCAQTLCPALEAKTNPPSSSQLRQKGILGSRPYLPFCKKFSRSSFRFSPSSWSSTNLRMTANSAWATEREKEHC